MQFPPHETFGAHMLEQMGINCLSPLNPDPESMGARNCYCAAAPHLVDSGPSRYFRRHVCMIEPQKQRK